jgi:hypothetical protein
MDNRFGGVRCTSSARGRAGRFHELVMVQPIRRYAETLSRRGATEPSTIPTTGCTSARDHRHLTPRRTIYSCLSSSTQARPDRNRLFPADFAWLAGRSGAPAPFTLCKYRRPVHERATTLASITFQAPTERFTVRLTTNIGVGSWEPGSCHVTFARNFAIPPCRSSSPNCITASNGSPHEPTPSCGHFRASSNVCTDAESDSSTPMMLANTLARR